MKKFLSVFLCLVMVCVYMPTMAWAEGEDAEIVRDIWVYKEAREDLTLNEVNSGQVMVEGEKAYLYYCSSTDMQSPAEPFDAETAEGFHFYDAEGNEAAEVPFSIAREGDFWVVTCTGEVMQNFALRYLETSEDGEEIIYGTVWMEKVNESGGGTSGDGGEEETHIMQFFASSKSPSENPTWEDDLSSGLSVPERSDVYLYLYNDNVVTPFDADDNLASQFYFYDDETETVGETADEVPFTVGVTEEGNYAVNYTGGDTGTYALGFTDLEGNIVYGYVTLNGMDVEEDKYVNVKYETDAIKSIIDFMSVADEVIVEGSVTKSNPLEVISQEDGITTAVSKWYDAGSTNHWLVIDVADGYYVDGFRIKAAEEEATEPYWYSTDSYFYALYDSEGNRIFTDVNYFDGEYAPGSIIDGEEGKSVAWIEFWLNGYDPSTDTALLPEEVDMEYVSGAMEQMKAKSSRSECLGTAVTYYISLPDPDAAEYIEVVTAAIPEVEGNAVKAYGKNNEEISLSAAEEVTAKIEQKESLQNYYNSGKEIEKIFELNVEGTLENSVEVVIPVANASEYDVVWFKDDNTPIPVTSKCTGNDNGIAFTTGHFSVYALVKNASSDSEEGSGDNEGGNTGGSWYPVVPRDPNKAAKSEAEKAVMGYVDAAEYDAAEAEEISAIIEQAKADIKAAKSADEIKAIEEAVKAELDKLETAEEKAVIAEVEGIKFKAKSNMTTLRGKRAVKITWEVPEGMEFDGFEVYRSTQRFKGFGKEPFFTTTKTSYTNNKDLKTGNTYYYKVKAFKYVNDEKVYTEYSFKAWRTIKK